MFCTMEENVPSFGTLENETTEKNKLPHPRIQDYKSRGKSDQQRRREELLERQKQKRRDMTEIAREIASGNDEHEEVIMSEAIPNQTSMEVVKLTKTERKKQAEERRVNFYKSQLMIPEFMTEIPTDLVGGWYCVPYPEQGQRCIVISATGITSSRTEDGKLLSRFSSGLPNGSTNVRGGGGRGSYCILDCVFHPETRIYFVLDMMAWKGNLYYDCPTDFRLYWMHTKLSETETKETSPFNEYRFIPLPYYECNASGITAVMQGPFIVNRQGLIFYNKETHYIIGSTPLVCALAIDLVIPTLSKLFT